MTANWHPDPTGQHELRYWDGQMWTEHVADRGVQGISPLPGSPAAAQQSQQAAAEADPYAHNAAHQTATTDDPYAQQPAAGSNDFSTTSDVDSSAGATVDERVTPDGAGQAEVDNPEVGPRAENATGADPFSSSGYGPTAGSTSSVGSHAGGYSDQHSGPFTPESDARDFGASDTDSAVNSESVVNNESALNSESSPDSRADEDLSDSVDVDGSDDPSYPSAEAGTDHSATHYSGAQYPSSSQTDVADADDSVRDESAGDRSGFDSGVGADVTDPAADRGPDTGGSTDGHLGDSSGRDAGETVGDDYAGPSPLSAGRVEDTPIRDTDLNRLGPDRGAGSAPQGDADGESASAVKIPADSGELAGALEADAPLSGEAEAESESNAQATYPGEGDSYGADSYGADPSGGDASAFGTRSPVAEATPPAQSPAVAGPELDGNETGDFVRDSGLGDDHAATGPSHDAQTGYQTPADTDLESHDEDDVINLAADDTSVSETPRRAEAGQTDADPAAQSDWSVGSDSSGDSPSFDASPGYESGQGDDASSGSAKVDDSVAADNDAFGDTVQDHSPLSASSPQFAVQEDTHGDSSAQSQSADRGLLAQAAGGAAAVTAGTYAADPAAATPAAASGPAPTPTQPANEPAANEPVANQSVANQSVANQSVANQPATPGISGDLIDGRFAEVDGTGPLLQNNRMLRISLGEPFLARQGSMVAYQGDVRFAYQGGGAARFLKRAVTGEGLSLMKVEGSGDVFIADTAKHVHILHLTDSGISVNGANVLAFSESLSWNVERVKGASIAAGGLFNTTLRGSGWLAIVTDGEPVVLNTTEAQTFADTDAVVAWSADLQTSLKSTASAGALIGRGSGEAVQVAFNGQGFVIVQPSEGYPEPQQA